MQDIKSALSNLSDEQRIALGKELLKRPKTGLRKKFGRGEEVLVMRDTSDAEPVSMIVSNVGSGRLTLVQDTAMYLEGVRKENERRERARQKPQA